MDAQLIGQLLLKRGFKDFFLYLFRVIENRPFIVEPIHKELFETFQNIHDLKDIRTVINICPRSAKTTLAKWFIIYSWTINPKCNFIYCSYSQNLLNSIANEIASILENPIYKAMYPCNRVITETLEINPINDFWRDYLISETGKNTYSSKKIITYAGGNCLFSSIGGQITGYGVAIRNSKDFSGALIIDDANKPADIHSETLRTKVYTYFEETLLSRLNNSDAPILNIQQRLSVDDLSGFLSENYNFKVIKKPLIDKDGQCQIPSQYTEQRIKELKTNEMMFMAQYQQEPIKWINDAFKGLQFATAEETKYIYNGCGHIDKGFDGTDGTAFTILKEYNGILYVLGKLWEAKHVDDCRNEIMIFREQLRCGTIFTEKNDDKGYFARNNLNVSLYHETMNKHFKIMTYLYPKWKQIKFIKGTDEAYIRQIQTYNEKAEHDDAPDSLASLIRAMETHTKVIGMRPF